MTHRHDDADPIEHDPTGMRALLGSLPDPGPMPEDLVARITAALDAEARRSGDAAAGWPVPPAPPVPLAPPEPLPAAAGTGPSPPSVVTPLRRRRWQVLGAAAAAVVVIGVGGVVVEQMAPGGLQASLGLGGGVDSAASAGSAASGAEADAPALRQPGVVARDDALHVLVLASGTDYLRADLAGQAGRLEAADAATTASGSSPSLGPGEPLSSAAGARACATSLGVDPSVPVVLDLARLDGTPVAVLVAAPPGGTHEAWAVQRTCRVGDPGVIAGPLPLG